MNYLPFNSDIIKEPKFRKTPDFIKACYFTIYASADYAGFLPLDLEDIAHKANVPMDRIKDEENFFNLTKGFIKKVGEDHLIVHNYVQWARISSEVYLLTPWSNKHQKVLKVAHEHLGAGVNDAFAALLECNPSLKFLDLSEGKHFLNSVVNKNGKEGDHKTKKAYQNSVVLYNSLMIPQDRITTTDKINNKSEITESNKIQNVDNNRYIEDDEYMKADF